MASSLNEIPAITGMAATRAQDVHAGVRLELLTIVWMTIEATVAVAAGVLARSVLLTAFGIDSVLELVTGGILFWRLLTEARGGGLARVERAEHRAAWVTGSALLLLCVYVATSATAALLMHTEPDASIAGIVIALAALIGMPLLARRKRDIAARINSAALHGDAVCSMTCACMAGTLLVGLVLNALLRWWWMDSLAAFGLLYWLSREAREALAGARAGRGGCACGGAACTD